MAGSYKALRIAKWGDFETITLQDVEYSNLKEGEIRVKMEYASLNPVDLLIAQGHFGTPLGLLGFEGSGVVTQSGGGNLADSLLNKKVALMSAGTWSEYITVSAAEVFPLHDSISLRDAASFIVNPFTVAGLIDRIKSGNHRAFIMDAASSAIGKFMVRWSKKNSVPGVFLVRKQDQVDLLKSLGAENVFNTSNDGWKIQVKAVCESIGASIGLDCISGTFIGDLTEMVVNGGTVVTYGSLSGEPCIVPLMQLTFACKTVGGFGLPVWLMKMSLEEKYRVSDFVQDNFDDVFKTEFSKEVCLTGVKDAMYSYMNAMTNNKILIRIKNE